jgi:hypothetical protein
MKKSIYSLLLAGMVLLVCFSSCKKEKIVGSLSGYIIDSQTGYGLANAKVSLTDDMTVTNGDNAKASAMTGLDGSYLIDKVEVGTYRMIVEANGYFPRIISDVQIVEGENSAPQQIIVAAPASGSFRIVLIWGEEPWDLDSHLTGPTADAGRFHVYFGNSYSDDETVDLDVDDVTSYGPETITIHSFLDGVYRYSVHNYSDQSSSGGYGIYGSPARVEVYDADGLVQGFDAPTCSVSANTWRVFEIVSSGSSVTVNAINEYVTAEASYDTETFKNSATKHPMSIVGF